MSSTDNNFELNLSLEELEKRTSKEYLTRKKLLTVDSPEYKSLADGDKKALKYLVRASKIFNKVYMMQDNPKNLEFKKFLENRTKNGNKQAELSLILFNAQLGMSSVDRNTNMVHLAKGQEPKAGKGFYPQDLSEKEFHQILIKMLKNGEKEEVKKILSQRTMVERKDDKLIGIDYADKFKAEFNEAADNLEEAAKYSTNKDFNEYLILQAKALRVADPMADAYADKKWAELQDTPLEFTISREQYEDELTGTVFQNEELKKLLEENEITPLSKDSLGGRVGIINKKGTQDLLAIKEYLPLLAENMPYNSEYKQNIVAKDNKQTMVDVDLIDLSGDHRAYRASIVIAQNLPNNDKMSIQIGGGRRNVYHRQIRQTSDKEKLQKRLDAILDKNQHKYYNDEADHWFTIGHENAHSLGPKENLEKLGIYASIIEENKADMASIAFMDLLEEKGMYTKEQKEQILVTFCADNFSKSKPALNQAHRVRSVMQLNYFLEKGAITISDEGILSVNIDKVVPAAKSMLDEIIQVQLSQDANKAKLFVEKHFIWTDKLEKVAENIRRTDKSLNGMIVSELADEIAK